MEFIRDVLWHYEITGPVSETKILAAAEDILFRRLERQGEIRNPKDSEHFLRMRLGALLHEEFHILWLDNRHRILACQKLFTGTVDGASVHLREVVRAALHHPSGVPEPSGADSAITGELKQALQLVGVRILDHIIVSADNCVSMASRGLI